MSTNPLFADSNAPTQSVINGGSSDAIQGVNQDKYKIVAPIEPEREIMAQTKWWKEATFGMFIP